MIDPRITVRPKRIRLVVAPTALLLLAVFTAVGVLLRRSETGVYFKLSDQVSMILVGVLLAGGALLLTLPRVRADSEAIEVRNLFTTQRFGWDVVEGISYPEGASWARLELPDDEYVGVMAIQAADRERAVAAIRELRALQEAYRQRARGAR